MSERLSDYDYHLPEDLIASRPLAHRDDSRMLVLDRLTGNVVHRHIKDFPDFLPAGAVVVMNDTRVLRARLLAEAGRVEVFLVEQRDPLNWLCLVRPGKRFQPGNSMEIAGTKVKVREIMEDGTRLMEFDSPPDLEHYGQVPIPPYFGRDADEEDAERYQTVYAKESGSVAAPTAGLHFTPELMARFPHVFVTLHVGLGTFQPVKTENVSEHKMHSEHYKISRETAEAINASGAVVAVGTTVARVLESQPPGPLAAREGTTDIFIRPPHDFRHVDALLTNFHLPKSTLLMLLSAMAGREKILEVYEEAVRERYRFFSYGDCMLVL